VFPDYPAPVIRNADTEEMVRMRWGMPPAPTLSMPASNLDNEP